MIERQKIAVFSRQVAMTLLANMKARYRGSLAGMLWVILNPLVIYGTQSFVFHYILKLQVPDYFVFLLTGLLPWLFMVQSIEMCTSIFVSNGRLLKAYPIHPLVCLLAQVLDNFLNLVLLICLIMIPTLLWTDLSSLKLLLLIIPLVASLLAVVGISWFLATLQIFYRDVRFIMSFVLNISFFLTPIFYPESFVEPRFQWVIAINPLYYLISPFRLLLVDPLGGAFFRSSAIALGVGAAFCLFSAAYWSRRRRIAYFYL
jgi:ABC-type polysaccharide/polyol phosphate export permease